MVDARYLVALLALGACAPRAVTSEVIVVPTTTMPSVRWECPRHLDKAELEAAGLPWPGVRGACDSCTTLDGQWVAARHMPSVGQHGLGRLGWDCQQCYRAQRGPSDPIFERCQCGTQGCDKGDIKVMSDVVTPWN